MKGDKKVIALLNKALQAELAASHQYLVHSHMMRNWRVDKLADYEYAEANDERGHADKFIERILFLEGTPEMTVGKFKIGQTIPEMLKFDLALEKEAVLMYRDAIKVCEDLLDYGTSDLFEDILQAEEGHVDHIEAMLWQIDNMGLQNFIQNHTSPAKPE